MILFYKNGNTLKIHNPSAETKHYQMPSVNSVLATEGDLTKVTTVSSAIKQPVILTPANNSTGFNGGITFTGFETIETFTGTLDAISIAIATDINFANVVVLQRVETTDASSFNIAVDLSSSDLYIKVKYHSDLYSSVWSNPVKTTTPEYFINKPTIIGPTNGQTGVALFPMISGSDFTYVGVDETHESTTYQIAKDVTFTNIAYNVTSTTDLTSHLITEDLDYKTTYYIRMRYNGSKYGNSEWSNTVVINTLEVDEKIIYFEYPSQGTNYFENNIRTLLKNNDNIFLTGYTTLTIDGQGALIDGYGNIKPYVIKLDSQLNVLKQAVIPYNGDIIYSKILINGNICLIGRVAYTKTYNAFIAIMDTSLNILKSLVFNLPDQSKNGTPIMNDQVGIFLEEYNNELYLFSTNNDSPTASTSLLKLNMDLTILNNKKYTNSVGATASCFRIFNNYIYLTISESYIIKMDLNFNIIKKYHLRIGVGARPGYFIINNNKLYVCSTSYINGYETTYIAILDLDLNILSCKKLLSGQIRDISIINNKIFLTGINYINNEKYYGYIGEYDINLNLISNIALSDNNATHKSILYGTTIINNGFISHGFIGNKQVLISYNDILDIPKDVLLGDTLISKTATVFNETTTAVLQEVTDLIVGTNSYAYHNNVLKLIPCNYLVKKTLDV